MRCATTSNLTEYCAATCARDACANPSKDITFGASERDPAPVLHLAKMTAAHASAHLALMSPHARIVASHASGFMPCFDPRIFRTTRAQRATLIQLQVHVVRRSVVALGARRREFRPARRERFERDGPLRRASVFGRGGDRGGHRRLARVRGRAAEQTEIRQSVKRLEWREPRSPRRVLREDASQRRRRRDIFRRRSVGRLGGGARSRRRRSFG